jgi:hypothetical protein
MGVSSPLLLLKALCVLSALSECLLIEQMGTFGAGTDVASPAQAFPGGSETW